MVNVKNVPDSASKDNFIHMQEGKGENFMFLPALLAVSCLWRK